MRHQFLNEKSRMMRMSLMAILFSVVFSSISPIFPIEVQAQTIDELKSKIDDHNATIKQLEQDIANYSSQADQANKTAQTLQSAVTQLDLSQKKLTASINLTQNQIDTANLTIQQLSLEIADKEKQIGNSGDAISKALSALYQSDSQPLIETLLNYKSTSSFWDEIEATSQFRDAISSHLLDLKQLHEDLTEKKAESVAEKAKSVSLQSTLADQKKVVQINKQQKTTLLTQTKDQESSYKKLVAQKTALRDQFQQELTNYESQLKLAIDPSKLPKVGSSPLQWPVDKVTITQFFGNTDFAKTVPQLYGGIGHNGIDLRAAIGTPIKAAANGVIKGTGNTDTVCPNASYGQWVLIEHDNGLSTLYGHLSLIKAVTGQRVSTGDVIGYSGQTGYATGPHLHFTVYATEGVKIMARKSLVCKGSYIMPIADLKAYLNPLSYLPQ